MAIAIGATSFQPRNNSSPEPQCADETEFPSYFADVQADFDWIYETIEKTLLFGREWSGGEYCSKIDLTQSEENP